MSWTDEKVAKLKELWGKGKTANQIAEIIGGISRNAVIGKAHRLNLSAKIKNRSQGKTKLTKTKKDFLAGKSLLEGLGISDKDRDDIFDLIELDNEGMYD